MESKSEVILLVLVFLLLFFCISKLIVSLGRYHRAKDIENLSKSTSSKLLIKKGIVFDKTNNTIVADQDIIV